MYLAAGVVLAAGVAVLAVVARLRAGGWQQKERASMQSDVRRAGMARPRELRRVSPTGEY